MVSMGCTEIWYGDIERGKKEEIDYVFVSVGKQRMNLINLNENEYKQYKLIL